MTERRKRGRPKGASRYKEQDARTIQAAARLMARGKAKNRTEAFRRVGEMDDSVIRRLLRGWEVEGRGEKALAKAQHEIEQERRRQSQTTASVSASEALGSAVASMNELMERTGVLEEMANIGRSSAMEALMDQQKRMQDLVHPPALRTLREAMQPLKLNDDLMRLSRRLSRGF